MELSTITFETDGRKIYKKNPTMSDISTFMEHPMSSQFYKKYLQKWYTIQY